MTMDHLPDAGVHVPDCLQRLGLECDADARAIKRAYARELKQIDQEHDASTFQDLRGAYEAALRWYAWRASEEKFWEGEPQEPTLADVEAGSGWRSAGPSALVPPASSMVDPYQLALRAFERFQLACQQLSEGHFCDDPDRWRALLQCELDHDDLLNISARSVFETRVAHQFLERWEPGHAPLFAAACIEFDWSQDQRRLHQFGRAGAYLDDAITETALFESLGAEDLRHARNLIALLRSDKPLATFDADKMPDVERLIVRFPRLMELNVNPDTIIRWRDKFGQPHTPLFHDTPPQESGNGINWTWLFIALVVSWHVFRFLSGSSEPTIAPASGIHDRLAQESWLQAPQLGAEWENRKAMLELLDAIKKDNDGYRPGPLVPSGRLAVQFTVLLDPSGKLTGVNKDKPSADPAYDAVVEAAIHRAGHFPAGKPTATFTIGIDIVHVQDPPGYRKPGQAGAPMPIR